jgi:hypothetical protein
VRGIWSRRSPLPPRVVPPPRRRFTQRRGGCTRVGSRRCSTWHWSVLVGFSLARPAGAEWFIDLYGGGAFTEDVDVTIRNDVRVDDQVKLDDELTGGGRVGFWLTGVRWLGVALDVSYFAPSGKSDRVETRLEVVPITPLVMFRFPLATTPQFPYGRVQPYLGAGVGFFVTQVKVDAPALGERRSDSQVEVGGDGRAGIAFMITPGIGLFTEGRYTFFRTNPGGGSTEFDVETFHALAGLTFRW